MATEDLDMYDASSQVVDNRLQYRNELNGVLNDALNQLSLLDIKVPQARVYPEIVSIAESETKTRLRGTSQKCGVSRNKSPGGYRYANGAGPYGPET